MIRALFALALLAGCDAPATPDGGFGADAGRADAGLADAGALPEPAMDYFARGPHPVGNVRVLLTDATRGRALPTELWYPAAEAARDDAERGQPLGAFEMEPPRADTLAGLIADADSTCLRATTRSAPAPEPAASPDRWPVVVFSHCHVCTRFDLAQVAERLASFGIAVAAPDHEENTLWDHLDGSAAEVGSEFLEVRVADVRFVLDALLDDGLEALPEALRGRFDPERAAVMGHSFGAATAGIAAARDARFRAGIAVAAPLTALGGGVTAGDITTPFAFVLAMEDNSITEAGNRLIRNEHRRLGAPSLLVEVEDAGHWSFSDHAGLVDLFAAGCGEGERQTSPGEAFTYLDNATARDVAAGVAAAFFGRHLLDDPGGLTPILRGHPSGVTTASLRE